MDGMEGPGQMAKMDKETGGTIDKGTNEVAKNPVRSDPMGVKDP